MKHLLASTCLVAGLMAMTGAARAECGDLTIASMNWQSAEVLAALDKFILTEGYGCNAEVIVGDTVPTITSMIEKGEPDLAPEGWVDLLPDVVNRGIEEGKLIGAAVALSDAAVQSLIQALKPSPRMPVLFVGHGSPMNAIEDTAEKAKPK